MRKKCCSGDEPLATLSRINGPRFESCMAYIIVIKETIGNQIVDLKTACLNFLIPFFSYDPHHRSGGSGRNAYDEDDEDHPRGGMQCQTH